MDKLGKRTTMVLQLAVLAMIVALVSVGLWQVHGSDPMLLSFQRPARPGQVITVMDTTCELHAVVPANAPDTADAALKDAQASLEQVERLLSAWKPDSEISRINEAGASQLIPLSPRTVEILALSRELAKQTGGAFDVTHAPVFNLWRRMGMLVEGEMISEEFARAMAGEQTAQQALDRIEKKWNYLLGYQ